MSLPSLPSRRLLLMAGPRAGKTRLLRYWAAETPSDSRYLRLTPEDREPDFLAYRLLRELPPEAPAEGETWGPRVASALNRVPDLCLFLDDAHVLEGAPSLPGLVEALSLLTPTIGLVLASRHALPVLDPGWEKVWGPEHPIWNAHPLVSDLLDLPAPLLAKAIALMVVGETPGSTEGEELVRRGVAQQKGESQTLRESWSDAARRALLLDLPPETWEVVERDLKDCWGRCRWTRQGEALLAKLPLIPEEVRRSRPLFLEIEGQVSLDVSDYETAYACFDQALAVASEDKELRLRLALQRLDACFRLDRPATDAESECLPEALAMDSAYLRGYALLLRGRYLACQGDHLAAEACWAEAARSLPETTRDQAMIQVWAEYNLLTSFTLRDEIGPARRCYRRIFTRSSRWGLERGLSQALLGRCVVTLLDETRPPAFVFRRIPDVPLPLGIRAYYLFYLGNRARHLGEPGLALRCLDHMERLAAAHHGMAYEIQLARAARMLVHAQHGELERARAEYGSIDRPAFYSGADVTHLYWVHSLLQLGAYEEASREMLADPPAYLRVRWDFLRLWLAYLQQESGLEPIRALIDSPEGRFLRRAEGRILQNLGVLEPPPVFKLRAFGSFELTRLGAPKPTWPRHRALVALSLLASHPEGLQTEELAERLFWDWLPSDPRDSLHSLLTSARKALRTIGGEHLLVTDRGRLHLATEAIAFNELTEFEAFFRQGQRHAEAGERDLAAFWFTIALHYVEGEPFENLPELDPRFREALRERILLARQGASELF
ncbi:hypothetical protein D3C72_197430 [compost metagenome]